MGPIAILRNWTFCLFYVMAELWGSVVVSLLFWGFANQARPLSLVFHANRTTLVVVSDLQLTWEQGLCAGQAGGLSCGLHAAHRFRRRLAGSGRMPHLVFQHGLYTSTVSCQCLTGCMLHLTIVQLGADATS